MSPTHQPRFGLGVPNGGDFADPHRIVELARAAEDAGWDGLFLWDHVVRRRPWQPMIDPWVTLAAVAVATDHIVLGPMVTPLARRRVSVVARETATLDVLSNGRLRFGVGLGAPDDEFTRFGEDADPRLRAQILDESLDALELLWSGDPATYRGEHVTVDDVQFLPRPVHGRVPVWVAGAWPGGAPFRRAARFDGVWPIPKASAQLSVAEFVDCVSFVAGHRAHDAPPFDACFVGRSAAGSDDEHDDTIGRLVDGGMTWWIDSLDDPSILFEQHLERVRGGPRTTAGS